MTAKKKKAALGRGLGALLENPESVLSSKSVDSGKFVAGAVAEIEIENIEKNPFQPRTDFEKEALDELTNSIKEQGVIQPLTVRKLSQGKYQLIAGERRLRASEMAGLDKVPVFIRIANDQQMLEMALVENIQRKDLNAIEIALSYKRLMEECKLTQEALSKRVGKNRATIANFLRLLKLPAEIQVAIRDEQISMGHARAIINIEETKTQLELLKKIINEDLSVRQVEIIAKAIKYPVVNETSSGKNQNNIPEKYVNFKKNLASKFETKIELKRDIKGKGNIIIPFKTDEELERIISIFNEQY